MRLGERSRAVRPAGDVSGVSRIISAAVSCGTPHRWLIIQPACSGQRRDRVEAVVMTVKQDVFKMSRLFRPVEENDRNKSS